MRRLALTLALLGGCGDAEDPCKGTCKPGQQCTIAPMTVPGGLFGPKTEYVHYCIDPSQAIRPLWSEGPPAPAP